MYPRILLVVVAVVLQGMPQRAPAMSSLSAERLQQYCSEYDKGKTPQSEGEHACVVYLRGFVDGALAADERLAKPADPQHKSWIDRARRTRLGLHRTTDCLNAYNDYCLGDSVSMEDVIDRVVAQLQSQSFQAGTTAQEAVHSILKQQFPCPGT